MTKAERVHILMQTARIEHVSAKRARATFKILLPMSSGFVILKFFELRLTFLYRLYSSGLGFELGLYVFLEHVFEDCFIQSSVRCRRFKDSSRDLHFVEAEAFSELELEC